MCKYVETVTRHYAGGGTYQETTLNLSAMLDDIAAELGLEKPPALDRDLNLPDYEHRKSIPLGGGAYIGLSKAWNWQRSGKISAYLGHADLRNLGQYSRPAMPECSFSYSKPIAKIAADIRRKILEPGAAAIAEIEQRAAAERARRGNLREAAESFKARYPHCSVELPKGDESSVRIYGRGWHGRLDSKGGLYVERLSTITAEKVDSLLAVIEGESD